MHSAGTSINVDGYMARHATPSASNSNRLLKATLLSPMGPPRVNKKSHPSTINVMRKERGGLTGGGETEKNRYRKKMFLKVMILRN